MIEFFPHKAIDYKKWDECISQSPEGRVYACSYFLDTVCMKWNAWIIPGKNAYEAVLPLPEKRFWGFPYSLTPPFTQQLGLFSSTQVPYQDFEEIITQLRKYNYIIYPFHSGNYNQYNSLLQPYSQPYPNFLLNLNQSYDAISQHFTEHHRKNIKKSLKETQFLNKESTPEIFQELYNNMFRKLRPPGFKASLLSRIYHNYPYSKFLMGVRSCNNALLAAACFLIYKDRIYYLAGLCSKDGRDNRAMFLIFNEVIKMYSNENYILDFEGSEIPGVARFFKGFGGKPEYFCTFSKMKYPAIVKTIRKIKNS